MPGNRLMRGNRFMTGNLFMKSNRLIKENPNLHPAGPGIFTVRCPVFGRPRRTVGRSLRSGLEAAAAKRAVKRHHGVPFAQAVA